MPVADGPSEALLSCTAQCGQAGLCMQVVAGLEPEATNAFLQLLGQATKIDDGASAVQVCWTWPCTSIRQGEFAWHCHQGDCVGPSGPPACGDGLLDHWQL